MTHTDLLDLVAAHAVDAIDGDERALTVAHLDTCDSCRGEYDGHLETLAALEPDAEPPGAVWDAVALEIAPAPVVRMRRRRIARVAVTAAAAVALVLGTAAIVRDDEPRLRDVAMRALDDPRATVTALRAPDGATVARAAVLPSGYGYLVLDEVPPARDGHVYQLWAAGGDAVSLGLCEGTERWNTMAFLIAGSTTELVLTDEPAGGSVVATGPIVARAPVDGAAILR